MRVVLSDAMYALGHVAEQGGEKVRLACDTDSAKLLQSVGLQNFTAGNVDRSILIFDVKGVGCTRMKPTTHATIGEETGRNHSAMRSRTSGAGGSPLHVRGAQWLSVDHGDSGACPKGRARSQRQFQ